MDASDELGAREVRVYSRGASPNSLWVLHAQGALRADSSEPVGGLSVWPPVGATVVDVADAYERLGGRGYAYGPAFRGLRALWRRGPEVFAEVTAGEDVTVGGFGIHPVVLDAALHGMGIAGEQGETMLPFSWQGVCLHAAGASRVRVRIVPVGSGAVSVELADGAGLPVLSVRELVVRPVSAGALSAAVSAAAGGGGGLFEVVWQPVAVGGNGEGVVVWEPGVRADGVVGSVHAAVHEALGVVQSLAGW